MFDNIKSSVFANHKKLKYMTYGGYFKCAEKHLNGCCSLLASYKPDSINDMNVWMELYYLSGYIGGNYYLFCI